MNKIGIIGLGNVGKTILYNLFLTMDNLDFVLLDHHEDRLKGEIIDFNHMLTNNVLKIGNYKDLEDCKIIIIATSIKYNSDRVVFLHNSYLMIKDIMDNLLTTNFKGDILVVSNPNDVLTTYVATRYNQKKVFGTGTYLDTNRLKYYLKEIYHEDIKNIDANVIGEHGLEQVILWNKVKIKNKKININDDLKKELENKVKNIAYEIVSLKGYTNFGVVSCVHNIIDSILNNKETIFPISSYDPLYQIAYSFPSKIINYEIVKEKNNLNKELYNSIKKIESEYNIFKNEIIIGIDLDDTITDIRDEMLKEALKFDKKINGKGIIDHTKYFVGEKYNWTIEQKEEFFNKHRRKIVENAKVRDYAIESLKRLSNLGYKIIIITARNKKYYKDPYNETKKWLDEHNIVYHKLIVDVESKKNICLKEKVNIFIDDLPKNCIEVSSIPGVSVYIMDNVDNTCNDLRIKRIYGFKDFLR